MRARRTGIERSGSALGALPALFAALLPKCPLCAAPMAAGLAALGVLPGSFAPVYGAWRTPLTLVAVGLSLLIVLRRAGRPAPLPIGAAFAGATLVVTGRLAEASALAAPLLGAGCALLLGAGIGADRCRCRVPAASEAIR